MWSKPFDINVSTEQLDQVAESLSKDLMERLNLSRDELQSIFRRMDQILETDLSQVLIEIIRNPQNKGELFLTVLKVIRHAIFESHLSTEELASHTSQWGIDWKPPVLL